MYEWLHGFPLGPKVLYHTYNPAGDADWRGPISNDSCVAAQHH